MRKFLVLGLGLAIVGCSSSDDGKSIVTAPENTPTFTLAWSEYPSWSVFGVAHEKGIIDGRKGKLGAVEQKHNVDIVLKEADYDTCLTVYGSSTVDASCQTNMDSLAPSLGRNSVVILATSTSVGGDACIAVDGIDLDKLKGKITYGLEKSVSQYCFERNLILKGKDPKDYPFKNMDPAAAAQALQTKQKNIESIIVWNPFVLQTLRTRKGSKVVFDSSTIPEEIIDCVVVGKDVLAKKGGDRFAAAVIDAYYQVNKLIDDPATKDKTLVALGEKFSNLNADDMKVVVKQTRFYNTPQKSLALFESEKFRTKTMPMVVDFCQTHGMVNKKPSVGFDKKDAQLNFDGSYLRKAAK